MGQLVLVGLVEPQADMEDAFNEWYLGNHVEDTARAPHVKLARCYRAVKGFLGEPPSGYLAIYEVNIDDPAEAERVLGDYQRDPQAWAERQPGNGSLKVIGAGWYEEVLAFDADGSPLAETPTTDTTQEIS